jgi:SpoVK/Ycf46/Vps4 family AAA+-type ATPase
MLEYFLLSRLSTSNFLYDVMIILVLIPLVTYLTSFMKNDAPSLIKRIYNSGWKKINFIGWESFLLGIYSFDYPLPMIAICHYVITNNLSQNIRQINLEKNSKFSYHLLETVKTNDNNVTYIIDDKIDVKISDDILIDFMTNRLHGSDEETNGRRQSSSWKVVLTIKSKKKSIEELRLFIDEIINNYKKYEREKNSDKIFHFIYQGIEKEKESLKFSQTILSDLKDLKNENFETFNNIFSDHKENIIKTVNKLKDITYYKKTGGKRKAGYLFYGPPGCGKTCHVTAIANYDKRHIIEVPMSRVKTNKELENIITLTQINDISFNKDEIIIFFDEIDQAGGALGKRDGERTEKTDDKTDNNEIKDLMLASLLTKNDSNSGSFGGTYVRSDDSLNLGCVLSRLDGIGNYNGLIIIAATNCKDKLSPALYRSGRLTPLLFDYCRREDITKMIEYHYDVILTKEQIGKLPDRTHNISPAMLRKYIDDENNCDKLVNFLYQRIK